MLATYNGATHLEAQLDSLMEQTVQNFVCYIHDDGSKDNTLSILKSYIEKYPGRFVLLDYPSQGGARQNFLSLLQRVDAQYTFFCDQDDVWKPEKMEKMLRCMKQIEAQEQRFMPVAVYCDAKVVDEQLNLIHESLMQYSGTPADAADWRRMLLGNMAPGCAMLFNRPLRERAANYVNLADVPTHDWWVMQLASLFGRVGFVNESLLLYRQHGSNTMGAPENINAISRVKRNLKLLTGNNLGRAKRIWLLECSRHARELLHQEKIPSECLPTVKGLADLMHMSTIQRVHFFATHELGNRKRNIVAALLMGGKAKPEEQ